MLEFLEFHLSYQAVISLEMLELRIIVRNTSLILRKVAGSLEFYGKFLEFSIILLEFSEHFA